MAPSLFLWFSANACAGSHRTSSQALPNVTIHYLAPGSFNSLAVHPMIATTSCLESKFAHLCRYNDCSLSSEDDENHFSLLRSMPCGARGHEMSKCAGSCLSNMRSFLVLQYCRSLSRSRYTSQAPQNNRARPLRFQGSLANGYCTYTPFFRIFPIYSRHIA